DDAVRPLDPVVRPHVGFPETGDRHRLPVSACDRVALHRATDRAALVVLGRGHDCAATPEGIGKHRQHCDRLRAGVDGPGCRLRAFRVVWEQTPGQPVQVPYTCLRMHTDDLTLAPGAAANVEFLVLVAE